MGTAIAIALGLIIILTAAAAYAPVDSLDLHYADAVTMIDDSEVAR